jgi:hypothetical protein
VGEIENEKEEEVRKNKTHIRHFQNPYSRKGNQIYNTTPQGCRGEKGWLIF